MDEPLLGYEAAAARLGITVRHLRSLRERREIPFVKVGRLIRFDPAELEAWLDENRTEAAN